MWGSKLIFATIQATKNVMLFWVMTQKTLGRIFFTFDFFDLLVLVQVVHCYIVLVSFIFVSLALFSNTVKYTCE